MLTTREISGVKTHLSGVNGVEKTLLWGKCIKIEEFVKHYPKKRQNHGIRWRTHHFTIDDLPRDCKHGFHPGRWTSDNVR